MNSFHFYAKWVNLSDRSIIPAKIQVVAGVIHEITPISESQLPTDAAYLLPGFIDSHVHIESSMLPPSEFARLATIHGTIATVSDPHEIANVCGIPGINFMIQDGQRTPFKFAFGAPSCVPATTFETSGATLNSSDIQSLLSRTEIKYLTEVMNVPGVLHQDPELLRKMAHAIDHGKPIDGHAPGLRGPLVRAYFCGNHSTPIITTDHECITLDEALEKLRLGIFVQIREGSAAKNFDALHPLIATHAQQLMFCSDDKHPDSLVQGHINQLCQRAIALGYDLYDILTIACINPIKHYQLDVGCLQVGDSADFILVKDLTHFEVLQTYIHGVKVAENGKPLIPSQPYPHSPINSFHRQPISTTDLVIPWRGESSIPVIVALDGQLITHSEQVSPTIHDHQIVANPESDILKIVVINRYQATPIAKGFIKNFGLRHGSIASSVAHDSHNIIAVGPDDESLCRAINQVIHSKGGIAAAQSPQVKLPQLPETLQLPLPIAGLMATSDGFEVANQYTQLDQFAKSLGSSLSSPWMTLSFMALLVIPHLKMSDLGLFDGDQFRLLSAPSPNA